MTHMHVHMQKYPTCLIIHIAIYTHAYKNTYSSPVELLIQDILKKGAPQRLGILQPSNQDHTTMS